MDFRGRKGSSLHISKELLTLSSPTSNSKPSMSPCKQSCQCSIKEQKPTASDKANSPAPSKTFAIGMMKTDPIEEAEKRAARLARFGPVKEDDLSLIHNSGHFRGPFSVHERDQERRSSSRRYRQNPSQGLKRDHEGHIKLSQRERGRSPVKSNKIADRHSGSTYRKPRPNRNI